MIKTISEGVRLKAFVTGGNSFIGTHLVSRLLADGFEVTVFVRNPEKLDNSLKDRVRVLRGDITDRSSLQQVPDDIDVVFHLASYVHKIPRTAEEIKYVFAVNVGGVKNLLECLPLSVGHVVNFSSVSVYGVDEGKMIDEAFRVTPVTPYGQSKLEAETLISEWAVQKGVSATSLRLPIVYGPGNKGNIQKMIEAVDRGRFIMIGKGENKRSMVHVANIVEAALAAAKRQSPGNMVYIVTDGVDNTLREVYQEISRALGKKPLPFYLPIPVAKAFALMGDLAGRAFPINSEVLGKLSGTLTFSSRKIKDEMGFVPKYDLSGTMDETIKAYRAEKARKH